MKKSVKKLLTVILTGKKTGKVGFDKYADCTLRDICYAAGFTPLYALGHLDDDPIGIAPDYADVDDDCHTTYYPDMYRATYFTKYDKHVLALAMGRKG